MKKILFPFLFFVSGIFSSFGQQESVLLRQPYQLKVVVDKNTTYEEDLAARPYLFPNNSVQIYPGETLFIEIELDADTIKYMKAVKEIKDPAKTITISFSQQVKKKVHETMMLKLENPFERQLSYDAKMYLLKHKKWVDTSIMPVEGGLSGIEMWPDLIISLALGNWRFKK